MTRRERFINCVTHKPVDRCIYDLCGSPQTLVDYGETRDGICRVLGIKSANHQPYGLDEAALAALDIDTRRIGGLPVPATGLEREEGGVVYNSFGIGYRSVGTHHEMCSHPLDGATCQQIAEYPMPDSDKIDDSLFDSWRNSAKLLYEQTDYVVVAEHPVLGVFELGCWMFGFEDFLYRCIAEPEAVELFFSHYWTFQSEVIRKYYSAVGEYIHCTTSGDDFGTQTGLFMSKELFDRLVMPYYKKRVCLTKSLTGAFYQHHTCGSVFELIPSLIDCGIDILNPIQPGVRNMEPERLKAAYGGKMAFWGGVDTQHLLNEGTVTDIEREVSHLLSILDVNGGYILSPAHTIQNDVPPENVVAIYRAADSYYSILD